MTRTQALLPAPHPLVARIRGARKFRGAERRRAMMLAWSNRLLTALDAARELDHDLVLIDRLRPNWLVNHVAAGCASSVNTLTITARVDEPRRVTILRCASCGGETMIHNEELRSQARRPPITAALIAGANHADEEALEP